LEIRQNCGTDSQFTSQFDFLRARSTYTSIPLDPEKRIYMPLAYLSYRFARSMRIQKICVF